MKYGIIEKNHDYIKTHESVGTPVESYILQEKTSLKSLDGKIREYPPGTWMLSSKITNPETIRKVENGEYTGYSVTVFPKDFANTQLPHSTKQSANNRIVDIEDPVAFAVSLVSSPCVRGAKFCSMKKNKGNGNMTENNDSKILNGIRDLLGSTKEDKVEYVTKADLEEMEKRLSKQFIASIDYAMKALSKPAKKKKRNTVAPEDEELEEEEDSTTQTESKPTENDEEEIDETEPAPEEEEDIDDEADEEYEEIRRRKKVRRKPKSKSSKVHNSQKPQATKSDASIVYSMMNRDATGSRIYEN